MISCTVEQSTPHIANGCDNPEGGIGMWYAVKTIYNKEKESCEFLSTLDGIAECYCPVVRKTRGQGNDESVKRFGQMVQGVVFVSVKCPKHPEQTREQASDSIIRKLVNGRGYFKTPALDELAVPAADLDVYAKIHLVCVNPQNTPLDEMIRGARVPVDELRLFRAFAERITDMEEFQVLGPDYEMREQEFDTIEIVDGPYAGFRGVVKQAGERGSRKGAKDRRLFMRMGAMSVCLPNVRKYSYIYIREASKGHRAETVNLWRHTDQLIGRLQAMGHTEDAAIRLRKMLTDALQFKTFDEYADSDACPFRQMKSDDKACLYSVYRYFCQAQQSQIGIDGLIQDVSLRPFLTPTSGQEIPDGQAYALVPHKDFTEIIIPVDLSSYFHDGNKQTKGEDYLYYAHVGVKPGAQQSTLEVFVNWGEYYREYARLSSDARVKFHERLRQFAYDRTCALFDNSKYSFREVLPGIGGWSASFRLPSSVSENTGTIAHDMLCDLLRSSFLSDVAASAVEIWQMGRLLDWRKLLQRHVLLHKIPVSDK